MINSESFEGIASKVDDSLLATYEDEGNVKNEEYVGFKASSLVHEYSSSLPKGSWQRYVLINAEDEYYDQIYDFYYKIVAYEVQLTNDEEEYQKAKSEKDSFITRFEQMSWQEYVKERKAKLESMQDSAGDQLFYIQAQIEGLDLRLKYEIDFSNNTRNDYINSYVSNRAYILENADKDKLEEYDKKQLDESEAQISEILYRFENDIKDYPMNSNNGIIENFYNEYFIMILIIIIIVAGSIVSEEFSKGTIKLLLVKPYSRTKILLSKYITAILMVFFAIVTVLGIQLIVGGIFFGYDTLAIPKLVYNFTTKTILEMNVFKYFLYNTIAVLPQLILLTTLAFSISTISLSTSLANTLTIVGSLAGDIINSIAVSYEINILKLFVTLNWDFTPYLFGGSSPYLGITLPFSIVVCLVYWLIMLIVTIIVFKRRNIKNI